MAKLTERQKKRIIADYAECGNYSAVAKRHKVAVNTVKSVVLSDEEFAKNCKHKKEQIEADILDELDKRKDVVLELYDAGISRIIELLETTKDIKGIAIALGTLIDKQTKRRELDFKQQELDFKRREVELKEKLAPSDDKANSLVDDWIQGVLENDGN